MRQERVADHPAGMGIVRAVEHQDRRVNFSLLCRSDDADMALSDCNTTDLYIVDRD